MLMEVAGAVLLLAAGASDVRTKRIPNVLTLGSTGGGLLAHSIMNGWEGALFSGLGVCIGFVPSMILFLIRAIGAGDVKLFAALGAWMGGAFAWQTLLASIMIGGVIAGGLLLFHYRSIGRRLYTAIALLTGSKSPDSLSPTFVRPATFPFMLAVLPAALVVYLWS